MVSTASLLQDVLSDPRLLRSFESYLRRINAHENLLFVEAMSQLRYESDSSNREIALNRYIYYGSSTPLLPTISKTKKKSYKLSQRLYN